MTMHERRRVFLNEACPHCGGKVYRYLLGSQGADLSCDSDIHFTQVRDQCTSERCLVVIREEKPVPWPCLRLEGVYDNWSDHLLTRAAFDEEIGRVLGSAGGTWRSQRS